MFELIGGRQADNRTWERYLAILRELLGRNTVTEDPGLTAATHAYLVLVSATLG